VSKKHYSSYVPAGTKVILTTQGVEQVVYENDQEKMFSNSGVTIDQIHGKVHIPHRKLTYKDLPSQL